jgi:flagellar biosynthesis protein FliR
VIEDLAFLADWARAELAQAFLVFLRVGAAMALLPGFGDQMIPARVRLGLALVFTAVILPPVAEVLPPIALDDLVGLALATEVIVGLAIGAALRLFVVALQIAGTIAAQSVSLTQILGATTGADPQPAIGHIMTISGLALAMIMDLHVKLALYLVASYDMLPPGAWPGADDFVTWGTAQVRAAFNLGFALAMPFMITSLIYNLTLGIINRAMPQLMVAFVGAPAITAGGLVLLMVALPLILNVWLASMDGFLSDPTAPPP